MAISATPSYFTQTNPTLSHPSSAANVKLTAAFPNTLCLCSRRPSKLASTTITASSSSGDGKSNQHNHRIDGILQKLHLKPPVHEQIQKLNVYEINEGDRRSPAFLKLSKLPEKSLGDIVTFSNKLYSGDLTTRLGITAGMIMYIEKDPEGGGDRYESAYSFYFGKYGHISVQGPYFSAMDSEMAVTGGTGIFEGVHGYVKVNNVAYPYKLFYAFELKGIQKLPLEVVGGELVVAKATGV